MLIQRACPIYALTHVYFLRLTFRLAWCLPQSLNNLNFALCVGLLDPHFMSHL